VRQTYTSKSRVSICTPFQLTVFIKSVEAQIAKFSLKQIKCSLFIIFLQSRLCRRSEALLISKANTTKLWLQLLSFSRHVSVSRNRNASSEDWSLSLMFWYYRPVLVGGTRTLTCIFQKLRLFLKGLRLASSPFNIRNASVLSYKN
jgi:hypothetical protein